MKFNKMLTPPIKALVILFFVQTAFAADGKWVQREGVGTGGTNWTEWVDVNNWTGGVVAAGSASHADLATAKGQYIRLPSETVSLKSIAGDAASNPVLCGDSLLQFGSPAGDFKYIALYTPWKWSHNNVYSGPYGVSVCADCTYLYSNCLWFETNRIRLDRYANSSDPVRVNACLPKDQGIKVNSTGGLVFMAPCGSSTNQTYSWSQTEGSKFLAPCAATGVLPVGAIVTGDGILPGTFLKRVFPDGTIELSAAVETTEAENELTFAPLRSDTTVRLGSYRGYNSSGLKFLVVEKYREEDDFRVEISYFGAASSTVANNGTFRLYAEDGFVPGVIALIADSAAEAILKLENIRLEIDANYSGLQLTVPNNAAHEARVSVTGALTKTVGKLTSVVGTFRKEGTGTLVVNELNAPVANLKVAEGALSVAAADENMSIPRLTIAAGARFDVPASGIHCDVLDVEDGSVIGGSGVLTYRALVGGTMPDVIIREAAIIRESSPAPADFSVRVNGTYATYTEGDSAILIIPSNTTIRVKGSGCVDAMLVAGGGGGGGDRGGGGGGGGVIITNELAVSDGLFGVTIGEGGRAGSVRTERRAGGNGGDSMMLGLTAIGGGGGGIRGAGSSGGSGGGGGGDYFYNGARTTKGGAGTDGQGFGGGASTNQNTHSQGGATSYSAAGGGGGAGGPGQNAPALGYSGAGGDGVECPFWKGHWFAGGGGGGNGASRRASGGKGGGGQGGIATDADYKDHDGDVGKAEDGQPLTGGGGGGGGCSGESNFSKCGAGGSGVLLLRVPLSAVIDGKKVYDDPIATGGDIRRRKGNAVHTFTQDGTFEVPEDIIADVLVVGGGGGGGTHGGGGGGGGGVVVISNFFFRAGSYPITVGKGGKGGSASAGAAGGASVIVNPFLSVASITALGGGRGGMRDNLPSVGGSGGGAGAQYFAYVVSCHTDGAAGTDGQGFGGGASTNDTKVGTKNGEWGVSAGGGGGGAGEPGADATSGRGGKGGDGVFCDFSGRAAYYGGGGGGGSTPYVSSPFYLTAGGLGGGGRGGAAENVDNVHVYGKSGEDGIDGLGGGGGGSGLASDNSTTGGKGGDGVVIIRYAVKPLGSLLLVR